MLLFDGWRWPFFALKRCFYYKIFVCFGNFSKSFEYQRRDKKDFTTFRERSQNFEDWIFRESFRNDKIKAFRSREINGKILFNFTSIVILIFDFKKSLRG